MPPRIVRMTANEGEQLTRGAFEVWGDVQGVSFRFHSQKMAEHLGVRGWIENTPRGTVIGAIEGEEKRVREMKGWLTKEGSPLSKIEKAKWTDERPICNYSFRDFTIRL